MKVLKQGAVKELLWIGECENCKSIIEANNNEINNINDDYVGSDARSWEKCPVCNSNHNIVCFFGINSMNAKRILNKIIPEA